MDELKAQELYDFFNKEGYDLGDLDNFKSALSDESKRMELYNFFNKEGYDVGDASDFILKKKDDSEVTSQNQPLDSSGKQGQVNISLGSEKTQEDTDSDSSIGTISLDEYELDTETEALFEEFQEAGVLSKQEISDIDEKIANEADGDFGFFGNIKKAILFNNAPLALSLGINPWDFSDAEDLKKEKARLNQIDFLEKLPDDKRQALIDYSVKRGNALSSESINAVAFNEALVSKYKNTQKKLGQLKAGYDIAEKQGKVDKISPEFFKDVEKLYNESQYLSSEIDKNNKIIENNNEDLSSFDDELDLLKRNYGTWKNLRDKTKWAATDIAVGVAQKLSNLQVDFMNPEKSDFGQAFSELFGQGIESDTKKYEKLDEERTDDNKRATQYIAQQRELLKPNMQVGDISDVADFGQWAAEQVAQQIPVITVMAATGGTAGAAIVGTGAAGGKELELKLENDDLVAQGKSPKYSDGEIDLASFGYGMAEFVFEKLGTGAILDQGKRIYKSILKDGLGGKFRTGLKRHVTANLGAVKDESVTEGFTQFFQNSIDKFYLDKNVNLLDGVTDAMASGGFMGHVMHASPVIAGLLTKPFSESKNRKAVRDNIKKIQEFKKELENENINEDAKKILIERIEELENENRTIVNSEINKVDRISTEDKNTLIEVDTQLENFKKSYVQISQDTAISEDAKSEVLSKIKSNIEALAKKKETILDKYKNNNESKNKQTEQDSKKETTNTESTTESTVDEGNVGKDNGKGETVEQTATIEEDTGEIKSTPESSVNAPQKTLSEEARKVQLKERESAKNRIKALRDKKNKKASDIKKIKREAVRWIKSVLGVDDINLLKKSEFNTIIQQLRDVEVDDKGNLKNPTDLNDILKNLEDQVNKTRSRKAQKSIDKILKTKLKDKQGKALVSQEGIDVINQVKELLADENVTIDMLDEMEASNENSETFEEAMAIAKEMLYAKMEGNSAQDTADFLESAQERLELAVGEGKLKIKELREADKQRKKENIKEARVDSSRKSRNELEIIEIFKKIKNSQSEQEVLDLVDELSTKTEDSNGYYSITSSELEGMNLQEMKDRMEINRDSYFESKDFNKQFKSKNVLLDKIFQTYRFISSDLDTLIDIVSKKMSDTFLGGYLHSKISDGIRIAEESYLSLTRKHKGAIHDKMIEIYSKGYSKFVNVTGDVVDSVIADTSQDLPTGVYDSNGNEIILSRGRAMWLYNQYKNSKLHPNFERAGLTPEVMSKITSEFLTEEDIQFADWLTNEYYPSVHSELNPVFKKLYFRNLPKIENYAGQIRYQGIDGVKSTDMLSDTGYAQEGATLFFGSGIDRVNNSRPIDTEQDVFSNLFRYTDSANRFISSAEIYRDIKEILNDDQVTDNFKKYNRGDIKPQIEKLIDLSFGFRDRKDSNIIINFLIGAKILSSLALTPKIVVSQIISTTLWLSENSTGVMGNTLKFMVNPVQGVKYLREIYENSEYIRKRYNDSSFVKVEAAYVAQNKNYGNKYRAVRLGKKGKDLLFGKVALANVMIGDALGMFILGVPYYKTIKDAALIKFDGDEAKATKYAIQEFNKRASKNQQSYQSNDRDLAQHTDLGKVVNMYGNSPKQYHRNTFQGFLQIKRAMQGKEYKGTVGGNIAKIVLNHMIQGALYQWVGTAMVGLLSDDDEEETKLKDIVWGAVFGSWSKFFIIGDLAQAAWDNYQGKPYGKNPQFTPITSDYAKLFREYSKYKKAVESNDDVAIEESSAEMYKVLMDLVGVPANKSENLYNNYKKVIEGDYGSDEEMILRLLNYSQYAIDHMDEQAIAEKDKEVRKKASETRKRREKYKKSKKTTSSNQNQFSKLK